MRRLQILFILLMVGVRQYFRNVVVWLDQGVAVLLLGGDEDETLSSLIGKTYRRHPLLAWLRTLLNTIDPGHTEATREDDEGRNAVWAVVARKRAELEARR